MDHLPATERPRPRLGCPYVAFLLFAGVVAAACLALMVGLIAEGLPCGKCEESYSSIILGITVFLVGTPSLAVLFIVRASRSWKRQVAAHDETHPHDDRR